MFPFAHTRSGFEAQQLVAKVLWAPDCALDIHPCSHLCASALACDDAQAMRREANSAEDNEQHETKRGNTRTRCVRAELTIFTLSFVRTTDTRDDERILFPQTSLHTCPREQHEQLQQTCFIEIAMRRTPFAW